MRRLYDASVLVVVFSRESASKRAVDMLLADPMPVINALGLAETRISLIRKRKRGEMTALEVQRSLVELQRALDEGLISIVFQPESMWDMAVAICDRVSVHLRTQDALHVACASLNGIGLATFDSDLALAARSEGVDVIG